ncbi:Uu.00g071930.m01.CDS01 [Anthostomella pinea]|uniref:Uu.00g071930.m01.CDS01 n=1 Tax=Anthostomella pinea TaxID=933095 RepID=A0AAI8YNS6_9PEZI|nr:Uu.00g071930.m01.CDS01 [Anthostomella pinea]
MRSWLLAKPISGTRSPYPARDAPPGPGPIHELLVQAGVEHATTRGHIVGTSNRTQLRARQAAAAAAAANAGQGGGQ